MSKYQVFRVVGGTLSVSPWLNTKGYETEAEAKAAAQKFNLGAYVVLAVFDTRTVTVKA